MSLVELSAAFPKDMVHWRAQAVNRDGNAAMALAYIDARAVMDRLDSVVGPQNWQDSYTETASGRVICTLSIRLGEEWVSKSDGAGSTDIEGDKGGLSDALKRAAVKWGIGRYLYDMPTPWVGCESYERNGKKHWSKWTEDPWSKVREPKPSNVTPIKKAEPKESNTYLDLHAAMRDNQTAAALKGWLNTNMAAINKLAPAERSKLETEYEQYRDGLKLVATSNA